MALGGIFVILAYPQLPSLEVLTDYRPKIPLRVYTADGYLIGEFGEERRNAGQSRGTAARMKQAILAAEDERFYQHSGNRHPGHHARGLFQLRRRRQTSGRIHDHHAGRAQLLPFVREDPVRASSTKRLLSFKIENNLTKDEILELYVNQIYLGQRAYGFAAAAQIYFGKPLKDITLAEAAMLAGLPKAPSSYNPSPIRSARASASCMCCGACTNSATSTTSNSPTPRRRPCGSSATSTTSASMPTTSPKWRARSPTSASRKMPTAWACSVVTTILQADQEAAYDALRRGVIDYDRRHGYRGAEAYVEPE